MINFQLLCGYLFAFWWIFSVTCFVIFVVLILITCLGIFNVVKWLESDRWD